MSYKYSKGAQVIGDLKAADDAERNTQIDFGEDQIDLQTGGNVRFKISGSNGEITFNQAYTFPYSDGNTNQILKTNGSGQLSWTDESGGGGSTNAAGSDGQIQYNNGGTNFGGAAQLYYDDSNNRLGIGISAPDQSLHIQDGNILLQHNAANNFSTELQFTKSRHATDGSHTVVQSGDILGEIVFKGSDGDEFVTAAAITAKVGFSSPGNNDMPGKIVFSTTQDGAASLTEAMRIDEGQNVVLENGAIIVKSAAAGVTIGEGTNSWQGAAFDSYSAAYNSKRGARIVSRGDTGTTNRGTFVLRLEQHDAGSGLEAIQVDANGNVKVTGGSVGTVSDSRVKENISILGTVLDKVKLLNPVEFDWADPIRNTDPDRVSNHDFGFIAQEVELIYPDAIYTGPETNDDMPDNLKTMSYASLIPILTKAIQEQQEQIEELKAQVAALQN